MTSRLALVIALVLGASAPRAESSLETARIRGRVVATTGAPVAGANIAIRQGKAVIARTTADARGDYGVSLRPGVYTVVITHRKAHVVRRVRAVAHKIARVNGRLPVQSDETIVIRDRGLAREAVALNFNRRETPPYSEEAKTRNVWVKSWLLLDVSARGQVTRVKFLNRPGYGLDDIALDQAFKLRFRPSLDVDGKPMSTLVLWAVEWPAYRWLIDMTGLASRMPDTIRLDPPISPHAVADPVAGAIRRSAASFGGGASQGPRASTEFLKNQLAGRDRLIAGDPPTLADTVPCRDGGRPLNLDKEFPIYRDCRRPDVEQDFDAVPWHTRAAWLAQRRE